MFEINFFKENEMEMRVRACVLAVVLILLGASSMFAQNTWTVGAPTGSTFAGANNFNLAMNREGNRELGAPVTICAATAGGAVAAGSGGVAAAGATTTTFNVGDVYTIEYFENGGGVGNPDPILATTGALGAANLFVVQSAAAGTQGITATATAAMIQPGTVAGQTPPPPQAFVTITITGGTAVATGINCVTIQGIRFDLGNTIVSPTLGPQGLGTGVVLTAKVSQTIINGVSTLPTTNPTLALPTTVAGSPGAGAVNPGLPAVATNVFGSAFTTLLQNGALGLANPTGYTTGGFNPAAFNSKNGLGPSTATAIIGGTAVGGTVSVQENVVPAQNGGVNVNLPIVAGGGLFRGFVASGPDVTTWLNASGATTGTQVTLQVNGIPAGASVVFPASVTSASPGVVWTMTGGGTLTASGSVTYSTTVNEGPSTSIGAPGNSVGPSMDIPFTVTPGTTAGTATVVITVAPVAGASAIPTYSSINGVTVIPSQAVGSAQTTLFSVATNQTTKYFPFATFTGGTTPADFDTGIALTNNGRTVKVVAGAPCYSVPPGGTIPVGCGGASAGTVSTFGTNIGQDGPFTVFFLSKGATVASIRSTAANFPNASTLTNGSVVQGQTYAALLSQLLTAAGVTGAYTGEIIIVTDFPQASGFVFISQFANPSGGATMGYKTTNITGENNNP
jgi:hypothetical protein